ncbi:MAG TPA: hypothetical protein PLP19_17685 [bacterium]|nr:hypothetical protein [bacterium]HPN45327.1 hypothetical protein [bacterium]
MNNKPGTHHRHSIRLQGFDYSQQGAYFITMCTQNRACFFGCINNGEMIYNALEEIARNEWEKLPKRFHNIELDVFQVMPNHVHGLLIICRNNFVGAPMKIRKNQKQTIWLGHPSRLSEKMGQIQLLIIGQGQALPLPLAI